jgi:H+/Cl- antiporter ClcA
LVALSDDLHLDVVTHRLRHCFVENDCVTETFILYQAINFFLILCAALLVVYGGPISAGSGVGEVKCAVLAPLPLATIFP